MANKKSNPALRLFLVGIAFIFIGGIATGFSLMLGSTNPDNKSLFDIIMFVGIGVAVLGLILLVSGIVAGKRGRKQNSQQQTENVTIERVDDKVIEPTYTFKPDSYEFVTVGRRQSIEEKFNEIGKMGKTQFVIYMCRLFSLKGYEVTYTPVAENHNIDLIVKRDGVSRAVGCLLANKVMCEEDIKPIYDGAAFYEVDGVAIVTNMYFDRTALGFAKSRKVTLIDRNVLIEQFMK